jgi:hypothetical protein
VEEARRSDAVHREGAAVPGTLHQINELPFHRQSRALGLSSRLVSAP